MRLLAGESNLTLIPLGAVVVHGPRYSSVGSPQQPPGAQFVAIPCRGRAFQHLEREKLCLTEARAGDGPISGAED